VDAASVVMATNPGTTGLQTFALFVNFFFPALALIVVSTRAAGRLATHKFGWDDSLVSIAMLMSIAETVISYFCEFGPPLFLRCRNQLLTAGSHQDKLRWHPARASAAA